MNGAELGQKRLKQLFQFLEAFNQQRNPVVRQIDEQYWTLRLENLPNHSSIRYISSEDENESYVLKIARPKLTNAPQPPKQISDWLKPGWDDCSKEVERIETQTRNGRDGSKVTEIFTDDPNRESSYVSWLEKRIEWAKIEKPVREAYKIFEKVYSLYNEIERESGRLELVLGDGILSWRLPSGGIYHPILLQRLQLIFNPHIPEFTFQETTQPVEIYTALLRANPEVDPKSIARIRDEVESASYHPLDSDNTTVFFKGLVQRLSPMGEFISSGSLKGEEDYPRLARDPVIFLRSGNLGYARAVEAILEEIPLLDLSDIPQSLQNITGITEQNRLEEPGHEVGLDGGGNEDPDILFNKPANPEQLLIARRLEMHGCVLVQGPPGTGKTHTIANLIGHILSKGQSVLVTSHTTKALRVLREKVDSRIQSLCVSVLDSDTDSQRLMSTSIEQIAERLNDDAKSLESKAAKLKDRRIRVISELESLRIALRNAREGEYRDIVIEGQSFAPSDAARFVNSGEGEYDWIPIPVNEYESLPFSESEIAELYDSNVDLTPADENDLIHHLPALDQLTLSQEFDSLIRELRDLSELNLDDRAELWAPGANSSGAQLLELLRQLELAVDPIHEDAQEKLTLINDGRRGPEFRKPWEELIEKIEHLAGFATRARSRIVEFGPKLSDEPPLDEQLKTLDEIIAHLNNGGGLGTWNLIFRSSWKSLIEQWGIDGGQPKELIHFTALREVAELEIRRASLGRRWDRQVVPLGGPSSNDFGTHPEEIYQQYANRFRALLDWEAQVWSPAESALRDAGFRWDEFLEEVPMEFRARGDLYRRAQAVRSHLPPVLNARTITLRRMELEKRIRNYRSSIVSGLPPNTQSDLLRDLVQAIDSRDSELHHKTCSRIIELHGKRRGFLRRGELLDRLETVAPAWANVIRIRKSPHEAGAPPGDPARAWLWRRLNAELEKRSKTSISELQEKIDRLVSELNNLTTQLIETSSWAHQIRRTGLKQRQSLNGWMQTMRKIGKGTGKRVPQLLAEARKQMENCRSAVPVWIMPLSRVVDNYRPQKGLFDVVIIDEASQCDVMGLVALYLGKKVIVVGDHEQVSPEAVGRNINDSQKLIDEYMQGIPNAHLYDGKLSIYDLAMQSFSGTICLREHFRCVPEIIQFSNDLSYDGKIKPLRDDSHSPLVPAVIAHRVANASSNSKINIEEARVVASLIAAAVERREYAGQTFGVISLVGNEQAEEIEKILRSQLPPVEFAARKITCGNAAQFQGDERDVMFLSMVDGPAGNGPLRMREVDLFKKRFNVAASRARNQLWVVHSLQPEIDLKPGDLRRRLIEYARDPQSYLREKERQLERTESEFERQVMKSLLDKGYVVTPQWKVGAYRIDMVVSGSGARLAVECDGDRWHPPEKISEDMERQAILERLGWKFVRIRGSEYFRNPDAAMERVFAKLSDLGIEPAGLESPINQNRNSGLDDILRRATQLKNEWLGYNDDDLSTGGIDMDELIDISPMQIAIELSDENSILDLD